MTWLIILYEAWPNVFIAFWHGQPAGGGQSVDGGGQTIDGGGQSVDGGGQRARENVLNNILSVTNGQIFILSPGVFRHKD